MNGGSFVRLVCAGALALVVSGCASVLGGNTPTTLYGLTAPDDYAMAFETPSWQMTVEEPLAERALDTDRIAIYTGPHALQYFPGARWTDRAPRIVQDLIVESFEHAGLHLSAGRQTAGVRPTVALISDLRAFEAVVAGAGGENVRPVTRVQLSARVVSLEGRTILAGRTFEAQQVAASDDVADVVTALNAATQQVIRELVIWSATTSSKGLPAS